jgi:4-amino-4-deoxy-L-arabinose transferase-like glycosyltransferase
MGLALGTKHTVLGFWGLLLAGILGWHLVTTRRWAKEALPHAALWSGLSLAIAAPWYVKSWLYTGNPVYPFFFGLFGGRYWNAENAVQYAQDQAQFGIGKDAA